LCAQHQQACFHDIVAPDQRFTAGMGQHITIAKGIIRMRWPYLQQMQPSHRRRAQMAAAPEPKV